MTWRHFLTTLHFMGTLRIKTQENSISQIAIESSFFFPVEKMSWSLNSAWHRWFRLKAINSVSVNWRYDLSSLYCYGHAEILWTTINTSGCDNRKKNYSGKWSYQDVRPTSLVWHLIVIHVFYGFSWIIPLCTLSSSCWL